MTNQTCKQLKQLPDNWQEILGTLQTPTTLEKVKEEFGIHTAALIRWRKANPDFNDAVLAKIPAYRRVSNEKQISVLTSDEIDEVLLDLVISPTKKTITLARRAICQLRREKKAVMSELNRRAHSKHLRL